MQRTRLVITVKKRKIRKKLQLAKTKTPRRPCWVKKGGKLMHGETKMWETKLMHGGKTSLQRKFLNQNGRIIFVCRENVFTSYAIFRDHI